MKLITGFDAAGFLREFGALAASMEGDAANTGIRGGSKRFQRAARTSAGGVVNLMKEYSEEAKSRCRVMLCGLSTWHTSTMRPGNLHKIVNILANTDCNLNPPTLWPPTELSWLLCDAPEAPESSNIVSNPSMQNSESPSLASRSKPSKFAMLSASERSDNRSPK